MKDLIIINSYTPDEKRTKILSDFVYQLNKENEFDIMVVSHSKISNDLYDKIDFFIYEKENTIITDFEYKYPMNYVTEKWILETTEARPFNHFIAAFRLFYLGLTNAKKLNYKKVHVIEYDTSINNLDFFIKNSEILENKSIVFYKTPYSPHILSFPMSFNIEKLEDSWFEYEEKKIYDFLKNKKFKTIESYLSHLLLNQNDTYGVDYSFIEENNVLINTFSSNPDPTWICPIVDNDSNDLRIFVLNKEDKKISIKCIINNQNLKIFNVNMNHWSFFTLDSFENVKNITIIKNNENLINYDFQKIDKNKFKEKNYIKHVRK